jgi:hypothetical protein
MHTVRRQYYDIGITRLTVLSSTSVPVVHKIFLRLSRFQGHGLCGVREGTASEARHRLAFDKPSAGIIQIAERNAIVEGHEEGVGIPAKGQMPSAMCV